MRRRSRRRPLRSANDRGTSAPPLAASPPPRPSSPCRGPSPRAARSARRSCPLRCGGRPACRRRARSPAGVSPRYLMCVATTTRTTEFVALGHAGSEHYAGLETFANPGVARVEMESDELTALCPVTGQPDLYRARIEYEPDAL